MAKQSSTVCKFCRRESMKLFLKGDRCYTDKCAIERRPYPPGQHGQGRTKLSGYGLQLREKQKVKRIYGLLERQFRVYFDRADRKKGATGPNLLSRMESRLDNTVYRVGFADSRSEARQLVRHGHFTVNGDVVSISNYILKPGDVIKVREKSQQITPIMRAMENVKKREIPEWAEMNPSEFTARVKKAPERGNITLPIEENLVVELYSR